MKEEFEAGRPIDSNALSEVSEDFLDRMRARAPREISRRALLLVGFAAGLVTATVAFYLLTIYFPHTRPAILDYQEAELAPIRERFRKPVSGLLTFRGNGRHTYYGEGPVPDQPKLLWRFPNKPMCSESRVGTEVKVWCGTGWTGQPVVWERPDGITEVIVGAYDRAVHFVDARTGRRTRPDFRTGDIIKGSITLDPDGDPLLYFGSRDNKLRIVALDRRRPTLLWSLNASFVPGIWNNDWDSSPRVHEDILFEGGENGYLFAFRLHKDYTPAGRVTVAPEPLIAYRAWTEDLLERVGDQNASIENSVAIFDNRLYFANSAGRVLGLDISHVHRGRTPLVFDFWAGDDVDASVVVDEEGMLYVAVEMERYLEAAYDLGQLMKLDPYRPEEPLVWSLQVPAALDDQKGGIWSTPALTDEVLYITTNSGILAAVDRQKGNILFTDQLGFHAWSSPVVVEDRLIVANCKGELRNYSIKNPRKPKHLWTTQIPTKACIESTPAVWKNRIIVGARDGYLYAFGNAGDGG